MQIFLQKFQLENSSDPCSERVKYSWQLYRIFLAEEIQAEGLKLDLLNGSECSCKKGRPGSNNAQTTLEAHALRRNVIHWRGHYSPVNIVRWHTEALALEQTK